MTNQRTRSVGTDTSYYAQNKLAENLGISQSIATNLARTAEDSALGIGQMASVGVKGTLWQYITPRAVKVVTSLPRALGGVTTLILSGGRIANSYLKEKEAGSTSFPETRKETFATSLSVAAGFAVGSASGLAIAGAAVIGAPAWATIGLAGAGVVAVGYAASVARDAALKWWKS